MSAQTDQQLLQAYARDRSQEAFAQLVRRHLQFVYAAALRQVRDPNLAEDATQAVFVLLAQKASRLKRGTILQGWLFNSTRYIALGALKMKARREHHERQAALVRAQQQHDCRELLDLSPLLDEALASLSAADRAGIVLSYLCGKTLREVGASLGVSEEAARKRVSRAIAKLRKFFLRRGVPIGFAVLPQAIGSAARANVPSGLVSKVVGGACGGSIAGASTSILVKGAIRMMFWTKMKVAACVVVAVTLLGGTGMVLITRAQQIELQPNAKGGSLSNGTVVQVLGVCHMPASAWWSADGAAIDPPADPPAGAGGIQGPTHALALSIVHPPGADYGTRFSVEGAGGWGMVTAKRGGAQAPGLNIVTIEPSAGAQVVNVKVAVASGQWRVVATSSGQGILATGGPGYDVCISPLSFTDKGRAFLTVSHTMPNSQTRVVAIDNAGTEHPAISHGGGSGDTLNQSAMEFDIPPNKIKKIQVLARPYDRSIEIQNITLDPAKRTDVQIVTNDNPPAK